MPTNTTNLNLKKPIVGADEDLWGGYINDNLDDLDDYLSGTTAIPALNVTGNVGIGTTNPSSYGQLTLYKDGANDTKLALANNGNGGGTVAWTLKHDTAWDLTLSHNAGIGGQNLIFGTKTSGGESMRIDSSGNVGIGTSSPSAPLQVQGSGGEVRLQRPTASQADWSFKLPSSGGDLTFYDNNNTEERMRIDSSGNLLVGKTADNFGVAGHQLWNIGIAYHTRDSGHSIALNRLNSDGDIAKFYKDGSTVGSIGNGSSSSIYIAGNTGALANLGFGGSSLIYPTVDNVADVGYSGGRFDDIYATNGTIQTSDEREKQDIAELDEAERRVAVAAKGLLRKFRWKDAVAEKGDDARIHFGIIAQDLQAAFAAEGLDAGDYAMFIHTTWWESTEVIPAVAEELDDKGNVVTEAQPERTVTHYHETQEEAPEGAVQRDRMGVRYPELLAFIIAAM